jgi:hypothetical protein
MKVKTLITLDYGLYTIPAGTELSVKPTALLKEPGYKVVEGKYEYCFIQSEFCERIFGEKTFTEKEVKAIENYHLAKFDKERSLKEQAQELVKGLTEKLNHKNDEIKKLNSYLALSVITLEMATKRLKDLEKA